MYLHKFLYDEVFHNSGIFWKGFTSFGVFFHLQFFIPCLQAVFSSEVSKDCLNRMLFTICCSFSTYFKKYSSYIKVQINFVSISIKKPANMKAWNAENIIVLACQHKYRQFMDHSIIIQMYIRGCKIFSSGMICLTISHLPMKSTILNTFHEKE